MIRVHVNSGYKVKLVGDMWFMTSCFNPVSLNNFISFGQRCTQKYARHITDGTVTTGQKIRL